MQLDHSRQQAQILRHGRSFAVEGRETLCSIYHTVPVYMKLVGAVVKFHIRRNMYVKR